MELEITAMSQCYEALKALDEDAQKRVIQWLVGKLGLSNITASAMVVDAKQVAVITNGQQYTPVTLPPANDNTGVANNSKDESANKGLESFESAAELFAKIKPEKEWEKALIVASYLQVKQSLADFTSFEINKELKNLGHGIGNITDALQASIDSKPQFILQLRKEGKSQQARKKYKVTTEGANHVKKMIQGE